MVWQVAVIAIISYLIGSINPSIIISKLLKKEDIRTQGSGNAGTTNTLRVLGKGPAIIVLLIDVLKAVVAVFLGRWIGTWGEYTPEIMDQLHDYAIMASALGAILGHNFPIYYGFKGGKGVATSLGVLLVVEWRIGLVCLVFAIVLMALTRMVSLGSIAAAILYPVLVFVLPVTAFKNNWLYLGFAVVLAVLVLVRHRANIKRLLNGTENKLFEKKNNLK